MMKRLLPLLGVFATACGPSAEPPSSEERDQGSDIAALSDVAGLDSSAEPDANDDSAESCDTLGCPCVDDRECASGYCVGGPTEGRVCSEFCSGSCSLPGYECRLLVNSGGDAVQLCVPSASSYCAPCTLSTDCPRLDDVCVAYDDGSFCAPDCTASQLCPAGAECAPLAEAPEAGSFCQPVDDVCTSCIDEDDDGFGRGPECEGSDCDEGDPAVHADAEELCNSEDDDCDGSVDEGFAFLTDVENCGACGLVCDLDNATAACADGVCSIAECDDGWGDCNDEAEDGCETDLTSDESCGTCAELGGLPGSECGTCGSGTWVCDGEGSVDCAGDRGEEALNDCGGCATLEFEIGSGCGTCDLGIWVCGPGATVVCSGDPGRDALNACGGCAILDQVPGAPCGTCESGTVTCVTENLTSCAGDLGDRARNACDGCSELPGSPGDPCPSCAALSLECFSTDTLICEMAECCTGATESTSCGRCGSSGRECVDGSWSDWLGCVEPECCAGDSDSRPCGGCGEQVRSCGGSTWNPWSVCTEPVCCDGDSELRGCGADGTQSRICAGEVWGEWSICDDGSECLDGDTEEGDCGCGARTRTCVGGAWGEWSSCDGLICCPGDTQDQVCGRCGSQTRDCDPSGTWSIWWTICMEPQCCAGDVDTQPCGGSGTRSRGCVGGVWDAWGECIDPT